MLHLHVIVSRKTPLDGRLEIPESLANRLSAAGSPVTIAFLGSEAGAGVEEMACTCAKGAGGNHRHYFLAADLLRSLPAGAAVNLSVDVDESQVGIELLT